MVDLIWIFEIVKLGVRIPQIFSSELSKNLFLFFYKSIYFFNKLIIFQFQFPIRSKKFQNVKCLEIEVLSGWKLIFDVFFIVSGLKIIRYFLGFGSFYLILLVWNFLRKFAGLLCWFLNGRLYETGLRESLGCRWILICSGFESY